MTSCFPSWLCRSMTAGYCKCLSVSRSKAVAGKVNVNSKILQHNLGHVVAENDIETGPEKAQTLKIWPMTKNLKELRPFLSFKATITDLLKTMQLYLMAVYQSAKGFADTSCYRSCTCMPVLLALEQRYTENRRVNPHQLAIGCTIWGLSQSESRHPTH